jgi:two-component system, NtrC family, sensor histidine kinase PilS
MAYPASAGRSLETVMQSVHTDEFRRKLLWLIGVRAVILFLALNLADPLGILPKHLGPFPSLPFFNLLTISLTISYLAMLWTNRWLQAQAYLQIGVDLLLATALVAHTRGVESVFVSFYLLIVIYCSLILGRRGAKTAAITGALLYSAVIVAERLRLLPAAAAQLAIMPLVYHISVHATGFFAVAFLGSHLSDRLHAVQEELEEKIDSLKQLQRLNEHIISSIRSGLITTDLQGRIAVFNDTAQELIEKTAAHSLGQPVWYVLGKPLWDQIVSSDLFKSARPLRYEEWVEMRSGTRRYLGFSVSPLVDQSRNLLGYIISFQDLTDIKRLEEEIRVKDRMAAVGRMAAGIAHEIRNPLTSMRGSVELLRSHLSLANNDERLFEIILRESDRLNKFVEDFLSFARPGKYPHQQMDLSALLKDSVALLLNNPEVRSRHAISLKLESPQIPVTGNADQLRQVFWNITRNGLRSMPEGGAITICARRLEGGAAEVVFADEGVGMTQEEQEQLFQPFHSGFAGGTGLGLSITFQILQDHQGSISVESEKGRGTKVTITLPS